MQELIKFIRKNAGLKQEEFAKAIGMTEEIVLKHRRDGLFLIDI